MTTTDQTETEPNLLPAVQETTETELVPAKSTRPSTGITVGGNTVTQATDHLPDSQKILVRAVHNIARENRWDAKQIEKETGISYSTWWRIWNDRYRYPSETRQTWCPKCDKQTKTDHGICVVCRSHAEVRVTPHAKANERIPLDTICETIAKWKATHDERLLRRNVTFVETSVWERVEWLCRRAFVTKKIGFVYGESQVGKTWALEEYTRRNNSGQTTYVRIPPSAGVQMMTRTIAKALHVASNTGYDKLIIDVMEALDSNKLLILDEIHEIFLTYQRQSVLRCMETIRYIHDKTKCGLVVCGTHVFRDAMKEGEFSKFLQQLYRRGLYELQLPTEPPRKDLDLIASNYGLDPATGDAEAIVKHVSHTHGLGMFCTRLEDAAEIANKRKQPLTWDHFVKAHNIAEKMSRPSN